MPPKTRITRQGTIHYLECLSCGVEKTTRTQRQKKLCRSCSDKNRRKQDIAEGLRECKVCKMVLPLTSEHFYSKDSKTGRFDRTCKTCDDKRKQKWNSDNRERKRQQGRDEWARNYERRKKDPCWVLKRRVSTAVCNTLKKQGSTKGGSTFSALPYSPQDLVEHLERQFDDKMNWDNYGDYWHVDHIYPQSLLPYSSLEEENFQKCWALENLQPLEATENMKKSNKVL